MIKGGSLVVSQETACQVLHDLIRLAAVEKDANFIDLVIDDCFDVFLVTVSSQNCQKTFLKIISFLTVHSSFDLVSCYIYKCFEKIVVMLDDRSTSSDHHLKVEICKFLSVMGQKLIEHRKTFIGLNTEFVIKRIVKLTTDRIVKVQMSARETLRIWKQMEKQYEEIDKQKTRVKFDIKDPQRLLQMNLEDSLLNSQEGSLRQGLPEINSRLNRGGEEAPKAPEMTKSQPRIRPQPQVQPRRSMVQNKPHDDSLEMKTFSSNQNSIARGQEVFKSNNLVEKTYLKQRAHNFQRKRTGTGGGFISEYDKKSKSRNKTSFNEMRKEFKQQVLRDRMQFQRGDTRGKYDNQIYERGDSPSQQHGHNEMTFGQEGQEEQYENEGYQTNPEQNDYDNSSPQNRGDSPTVEQPAQEIAWKEAQLESGDQAQVPQFPSSQQGPINAIQQQKLPQPQGDKPEGDENNTQTGKTNLQDASSTSSIDSAADEAPPQPYVSNMPASTVRASTQGSEVFPSQRGPQTEQQASTVYGEGSLADTKYYDKGQLQSSWENKGTQFYDDRTILCESTDSRSQNRSCSPESSDSLQNSGCLDSLVLGWNEALLALSANKLEEAYSKVLALGDDLYLLRLMAKTGACYQSLRPQTALEVEKRAKAMQDNACVEEIVQGFIRGNPNIQERSMASPQELDPLEQTQQYGRNREFSREEVYRSPFMQIVHRSDRPNEDSIRNQSMKSSNLSNRPYSLAPTQSFPSPMPPQSGYYPQFPLEQENGTERRALTKELSAEESLKRAQMEKLQQEAAEVYEILKKQL